MFRLFLIAAIVAAGGLLASSSPAEAGGFRSFGRQTVIVQNRGFSGFRSQNVIVRGGFPSFNRSSVVISGGGGCHSGGASVFVIR